MRVTNLILPSIAALALAAGLPAGAAASGGSKSGSGGSGGSGPSASGGSGPGSPGMTGGAGVTPPPAPPSTPEQPIVQGSVAKIVDGVAFAPSMAPVQVQRAIWAGDQIRKKPYIFGGGHGKFKDRGYDCSGSVSFVLHAAGLIRHPMDSSDFMSWGESGLGQWITVYTNPGHAFVEIAGIRFDTSAEADPHPAPGTGPRWRPLYMHPQGFMARHPIGF